MRFRPLARPAVVALAFSLALPALAADWPQWQGPDRTNVSKETGLLKQWPAEGPKLLWTFRNAGVGYSSPAIVGSRLYAMGTRENQQTLYAVDTSTGNEVWATPFAPDYDNNWGNGPRGTPTVDGAAIYALGANGDLVCVRADNGGIVWKKNLVTDLGGQLMSNWGYAESPLVDGDKVIVCPGGGQGTVAALDKRTGNVLWRSKELVDPAAYSSVIVADPGGVRHYVLMTGKGFAGISPKDGAQLWYYRQVRLRTAVIPTPIYHDGLAYFTAEYGHGSTLLKLTGKDDGTVSAEQVYEGNRNMANHHGGVVLIGDHLYGATGNSNARAAWECLDLKTCDIVWSEATKLEGGSLTSADGKLYCYGQRTGTCVLADAATTGWKENGRLTIPEQTKLPRKSGFIWTHPAVANGKLFLRDQDLIFCYDVKAR